MGRHENNLEVCKALIGKATQNVEALAKAEVGTCTARHHYEVGVLDGLVAIAASVLAVGAIMNEQLEAMKAVEVVVLHPKKRTAKKKEDQSGEDH